MRLPLVSLGDEGQLRDAHGALRIAHDGEKLLVEERRADVAQHDGALGRRRNRTAGHDAGLLARRIDKLRAVPYRSRVRADQPDQAPRHAFAGLAQVDLGARKATLLLAACAARRRNRPAEARFERRRALVHVLSVKVQTGFEPQRVARAEPDWLYRGVLQQLPRERFGLFLGQRNLEAVLAGVARARNQPVAEHAGLHEAQLTCFRSDGRKGGLRRRALNGYERAIEELEGKRRGERAQQREVLLTAARIDDDAHLVREARDHEVVLDAAALVEKQRVALSAERPAVEIERQRALERRVQAAPSDADLAHVRDVEQARVRARVQVLGTQAIAVLDRHVEPSEGYEARAQLGMH